MNAMIRWALAVVIIVGAAAAVLMFGAFATGLKWWSVLKLVNDGAGQLLTFAAAAFAIYFGWREYRVRNSPQLTIRFHGSSNDNERVIPCVAKNTNPYPVLLSIEKIRFKGIDETPPSTNRVLLRDGEEILQTVTTHVIPHESDPEIELACVIESAVPPYHRSRLTLAARLSSPNQSGPPVADVSQFLIVPLRRKRRRTWL